MDDLRRVLAIFAAVLMFIGLLPAAASVAGRGAPGATADAGRPADGPDRMVAAEPGDVRSAPRFALDKASEAGLYLVRLGEDPVATYDGGVPGYAPTSARSRGEDRFDPDSPAARRYDGYVRGRQNQFIARARQRLRKAMLDVRFRYTMSDNGLAIHLTPAEAERVAVMPEVVYMQRDRVHVLHTDAGPSWVGAPGAWEGLELPQGARGEGMVVGVIDTGIMPSNPSFAAVSQPGTADEYVHRWEGGYLGVCDEDHPHYDPSFPCNDKLIGAYGFATANNAAGDPYDWDGHGSHTASTAAGNPVSGAQVVGAEPDDPMVLRADISGVAPRAHIIAYSACCSTSGLSAAIDQAVADGVDVINYSIGSDAPTPAMWADFDTVGFLNARVAGIFVATSAGNAGPGAATVGSPSDAPWITTVAATTHDRVAANALEAMTGGGTPAPGDIVGRGLSNGVGPAPIVYAGDHGDPSCGPRTDSTSPFPAGALTGKIVVCDRGLHGRVEKGAVVAEAGAVGMVLANDPASGGSLNSDAHVLPTVHISSADGDAVKAWLASGSDHTATIRGTYVERDDAHADRMARFSSRGPNRTVDTIAPDLAAPGVDILAALGVGDPDPPQWGMISGTSMAAPHVAGAGALLMQLHPGWSPAEVQSALMTTAATTVRNEDGETPADPFDVGAGRIRVDRAARAGLLLDESQERYLAADPAAGGNPASLNLASMSNAECPLGCTWTRTVRGAVDRAVTWDVSVVSPASGTLSVSPASFTLHGLDDTQELEVSIDVSAAPVGAYQFGQVLLTPSDAAIPDAHLPVAAALYTGVLPAAVTIDAQRDAGSQLVTGLESVGFTELRIDAHGLARADEIVAAVGQDPDPDDPFSDLDEVYWTTVEIPPDTLRWLIETSSGTSADLDLIVGTGTSPVESSVVCSSHALAAGERCDVQTPEPGTWWVLVQNWAASAPDAVDAFTLVSAVVPASDAGNLHARGPSSVPERQPFDVRVFWDEPRMAEGERWYGAISLGTDTTSPGRLGTIPVEIVRGRDDVTKSADVAEAYRGDTITYTVEVQPNMTGGDLTYTITDTLPAGLTYVPGSASMTPATTDDGELTWTIAMPAARPTYGMSTRAADPTCAVPGATDGGYSDLTARGLHPRADIAGDDFRVRLFDTGSPLNYWGQDHSGIDLLPSGVAMFGPEPGSFYDPQAIPDAADPNGVLAFLWHDLYVEYSAGPTDPRGVTTAEIGGTGPGGGVLVDVKGAEDWETGTQRYTAQMFMRRQPGPGPEIVFAWNDLGDLSGRFTIGIEDLLGTEAIGLVNAGAAAGIVEDGSAVCFDWETGDPVVLTYEATVDEDAPVGPVTNVAAHATDGPGSRPAATTATVEIVSPPSPPTDLRLMTGNREITVQWSPPSDDGSSPVTGYLLTAQPGDHTAEVGAGAGQHRFTGLSNGTVYTISVTAVNDHGTGAAATGTARPPASSGPPPRPDCPEPRCDPPSG